MLGWWFLGVIQLTNVCILDIWKLKNGKFHLFFIIDIITIFLIKMNIFLTWARFSHSFVVIKIVNTMNTYEYSFVYFFSFALRAISPSLFFWDFFLYETPAILHLARPINWRQKMPSFFRKVSNLFMSNFLECIVG